MSSFNDFNLSKHLNSALADMGLSQPTPIQTEAFPVILSGKDIVGIAQTGTGKTLAYLLPILQEHKYRTSKNPRIIILVPTRELVVQVVEVIKKLTAYMTIRVVGVYGGANINTQKATVSEGVDILVGTPGRLYDIAMTKVVQMNEVKKLVIDEVDVMLDEGFRHQLANIFDILPEKRQNIMFSASMTDEVEELIEDFFTTPEKVTIAVSGTRLENIAQRCFSVPNYFTKINLLSFLLRHTQEFTKVLVFVSSKNIADRVYDNLVEEFETELSVIHSNKSQNYRLKSIKDFDGGTHRILISTDVMARGLDLDNISHVINFDTPAYPENYMHRIGRCGRAEQEGKTILFYTEKEEEAKNAIEKLMNYSIPKLKFPSVVEISKRLAPEEKPNMTGTSVKLKRKKIDETNAAFHEKKEKNTKINLGSKYKREPKSFSGPLTKGDKIANQKHAKRKK